MRLKAPLFEWKGESGDGLPPVSRAGVRLLLLPSYQRAVMVGGRLGALLLITRSSTRSADSLASEGTQNGKRGIRFVSYEQLTMAEK